MDGTVSLVYAFIYLNTMMCDWLLHRHLGGSADGQFCEYDVSSRLI